MSVLRLDDLDRPVEHWDDDTLTYTRFAPDGSVVEQRPYLDGEVAGGDAQLAANAAGENEATLREQARASIDTLRATADAMQAILDKTNANIGPSDTKAIAREVKRMSRQLVAITRLVVRQLDSADTGTP